MTFTIGFVGASHLSYVSAIAAAEKCGDGFKVVCYAQEHLFEKGKPETLSIQEPDLLRLLDKNKAHLTFTRNLTDISQCELVYLAIDVPTDDQGTSNLSIIRKQIEEMISHLSNSAILVILSQVPPGFTRSIPFPQERLFYQVETLIFGKAMERALFPERFIIGNFGKTKHLPQSYETYLKKFNCPIFVMNYESAELAKISINLYLVATVTTTNTLAEICQHVGADWEDIAETLRLDKRIGPHAYLIPGLGLAGGNLERDLATIQKIAFDHGCFAKLIDAELEDSSYRLHWGLRMLKQHCKMIENQKIGILGLTYKENTHSLKNSASLKFLKSIGKEQRVYVYDPAVTNLKDHAHINFCKTADDVIKNSTVLAIMTPWPEFSKVNYETFSGDIIDPYGMIKQKNGDSKIYQIGKPIC